MMMVLLFMSSPQVAGYGPRQQDAEIQLRVLALAGWVQRIGASAVVAWMSGVSEARVEHLPLVDFDIRGRRHPRAGPVAGGDSLASTATAVQPTLQGALLLKCLHRYCFEWSEGNTQRCRSLSSSLEEVVRPAVELDRVRVLAELVEFDRRDGKFGPRGTSPRV